MEELKEKLELFKPEVKHVVRACLISLISILMVYFGFGVPYYEYQEYLQYFIYLNTVMALIILFLVHTLYRNLRNSQDQTKIEDKYKIFRRIAENSYHPMMYHISNITTLINLLIIATSAAALTAPLFLYGYIFLAFLVIWWQRIIHEEIMILVSEEN